MCENQNKSMDIFDKIIHLSSFRIIEPFYRKHKETLLYLFFGGFAFFLNIGLFTFLNYMFYQNEIINSAICWFLCVLFQFFTNRIWVFENINNTNEIYRQMIKFFLGRVVTLVIEEIILIVFITWLAFNSILVKLCAQVIVILFNYIISKLLIFKK